LIKEDDDDYDLKFLIIYFRPKDLVLDDLDRDKFVRVIPPEELPKREVMLGQRAGKQNYWFHVATSRHEEVKIN